MNARDRHHEWAVAQWSEIEPPLLTCGSVVSEASLLLAQTRAGGATVLEMLKRGVLDTAFRRRLRAVSPFGWFERGTSLPLGGQAGPWSLRAAKQWRA